MNSLNRLGRNSFSVALVLWLFSVAAPAEVEAVFEFAEEPAWVVSRTGFRGSIRISGAQEIERVVVSRSVPGLQDASVSAERDTNDPQRYTFEISPMPGAGPGDLQYAAEAFLGAGRSASLRSETRILPLALEQELDITGDAAIALLYPLGGPEYTVRYVPCCNIFGGVTTATRLPVNPEPTKEGLPKQLLSDFIVLKPDGLSASTMGMYFDFLLGPERMKNLTPVLYEFDGAAWVQFKSAEVDLAAGRLSMHCPNGGTFVVAAKP